ncbi:MAG: hypothetical protein ACREDR_47335 [Blastocatellia bacterium]
MNQVTVNGGLTVDGGAHLRLTNSTVDGGINVQPGGELDVQATTNGAGQPIPGSSTINGGIVANNPFDIDLRSSVIHGGVSIAGPGTISAVYSVCNVDIRGGLTVTNLNGSPADIGSGSTPLSACAGNNIDGSVTIDRSLVVALVGNTINGSLVCINRGVVSSNSGNSITGPNTCS